MVSSGVWRQRGSWVCVKPVNKGWHIISLTRESERERGNVSRSHIRTYTRHYLRDTVIQSSDFSQNHFPFQLWNPPDALPFYHDLLFPLSDKLDDMIGWECHKIFFSFWRLNADWLHQEDRHNHQHDLVRQGSNWIQSRGETVITRACDTSNDDIPL